MIGTPLEEKISGQNTTLIEEAYRQIKKLIFDQRIVPGQRLIYQDLVSQLEMSRTPIINALNRLDQEGFVKYEDFRGFYVKPIDIQEVWDGFGVREALERYAVEQAIMQGEAEDLLLLEEKQKTYAEYMPHYYTQSKFLLDSEFHTQIAAMAKNRVLKYLLKRNFEHIFLRARLDHYDPQRMMPEREEHQRLIDGIRRKDIIGSLEIVKNHVQTVRDQVLRCLSQNT